jgi:ketosteroid isomerase-like protein
MRMAPVLRIVCIGLLTACASMPPKANVGVLNQQVTETERAFAKTMADRDHAAFTAFIANDAIFFSAAGPLHGKQRIADAWIRYYEKADAPLSWEPERVEVLESGTLALSTGPVRDAKGKVFATFSSIWRLEAPGVWHIVFDKGNEICDCPKP